MIQGPDRKRRVHLAGDSNNAWVSDRKYKVNNLGTVTGFLALANFCNTNCFRFRRHVMGSGASTIPLLEDGVADGDGGAKCNRSGGKKTQ